MLTESSIRYWTASARYGARKSRGVARETLAARRLLAEAARTEAVTAQLVARVRDRLGTGTEP